MDEDKKITTYIVQKGDNLSKIAKANNMSLQEIEEMNTQIENYNLIYEGDEITIIDNNVNTADEEKTDETQKNKQIVKDKTENMDLTSEENKTENNDTKNAETNTTTEDTNSTKYEVLGTNSIELLDTNGSFSLPFSNGISNIKSIEVKSIDNNTGTIEFKVNGNADNGKYTIHAETDGKIISVGNNTKDGNYIEVEYEKDGSTFVVKYFNITNLENLKEGILVKRGTTLGNIEGNDNLKVNISQDGYSVSSHLYIMGTDDVYAGDEVYNKSGNLKKSENRPQNIEVVSEDAEQLEDKSNTNTDNTSSTTDTEVMEFETAEEEKEREITAEELQNYYIEHAYTGEMKDIEDFDKMENLVDYQLDFNGIFMLPFSDPEGNRTIKISSWYGKRNTGIKDASTNHGGVDLIIEKPGDSKKEKRSVEIVSVCEGEVVEAGYNKGKGNYVIIEQEGTGVRIIYMHMSQKPVVSKGDKVIRGQELGIQGTTGTSSGEHLHFQVEIDNKPVDPIPYLFGEEEAANLKKNKNFYANNTNLLVDEEEVIDEEQVEEAEKIEVKTVEENNTETSTEREAKTTEETKIEVLNVVKETEQTNEDVANTEVNSYEIDITPTDLNLSTDQPYPVDYKTCLTLSRGRVQFNGHDETYYAEEVLPGKGLKIPDRHVANDGTIRDKDGYICVAANTYSDETCKGTVIQTSLGPAKVYDHCEASEGNPGQIDIYINEKQMKKYNDELKKQGLIK